jgi:hypothetical protein
MQGKETDHQGETSLRGGGFRRKDQGNEEGLHEQMECHGGMALGI